MALSVGSGIEALQASLHAGGASDPALESRLSHVQASLATDFTWIEKQLATAAGEGRAPGSDAAAHLIGRGGKRIRPMALLLSARCFGDISQAARELCVVVELVHSATLMHDDVIDDGDERRGAPAARRLWGNAVSVLSGDLMLVSALERTQRYAPELLPELLGTLRKLVDGEIVQLRGRSALDVTEKTYELILRDKTASLFGWATWVGARLGGASEENQRAMARFGELLGIAFQLVDDALDYDGERTGKTLFADLREGKMTLPLVLAMQRVPDLAEKVRRIHAGDADGIDAMSRAVVESGACVDVRDRAARATGDAISALERVPESPWRDLLEAAARELAQRGG